MPFNGVPDRWEEYSDCGKIIPGTSFIAFKVPLKDSLCDKLEDQSLRFTINDLLSHLSKNHLNVGLVIDLTNTARYYDPKVFLSSRVHHIKLSTPGHNVTPSDEVFQQFRNHVRQYESSNPGGLIGVHCTHGVNRTGYLICRYMIEELGMEALEAIEAFKVARGHEMEKYIDELTSIQPKSITLETPSLVHYHTPNPIRGHSSTSHHSQRDHKDPHLRVQASIKKHKPKKYRNTSYNSIAQFDSIFSNDQYEDTNYSRSYDSDHQFSRPYHSGGRSHNDSDHQFSRPYHSGGRSHNDSDHQFSRPYHSGGRSHGHHRSHKSKRFETKHYRHR